MPDGSRASPSRSARFARMVPSDRLRIDVRLTPCDPFELTAGEHRRLVAEERRVRTRTLAVRQHRVGARLVAEFHGEDPSVATPVATRLPSGIIAVSEHAKAPEVARAAADRHVHAAAANAVDIAPGDVEAAIAPDRLRDRPRERLGGARRRLEATRRRRRRDGAPRLRIRAVGRARRGRGISATTFRTACRRGSPGSRSCPTLAMRSIACATSPCGFVARTAATRSSRTRSASSMRYECLSATTSSRLIRRSLSMRSIANWLRRPRRGGGKYARHLRGIERRTHVGEVRRVVLVVHVAAGWIQHLRQRIERDVCAPRVARTPNRNRDAVAAARMRQRREATHSTGSRCSLRGRRR